MHTVEPATINYTSSGETSAATRNNAPSSPPFPVASIRNAPSLLCGFHPQGPPRPFPAASILKAPLVPSLPCGFHPQCPVPSLRLPSSKPSSSRPFPADFIRNAPSLRLPSSKPPSSRPCGFHPQSPLVPSLPCGFHPHNHLLPRVLRPYRRHIRVPLLWRELIRRHSIALFHILYRINPSPLHHHSPYSGSCRYHPCHPRTQDRSPAYCHSHLIRKRMMRNTLRKHLTPLLP